jgi:DNA polymerase
MGFVPPEGPENAPILIMGEAPGYEEQAMGRPFVGAAGSMLERILRRNRLNRGQFRIGNILSCVPPGMQLEGMPYQHTAIEHCRVHREPLLNECHPVVLATGGTALKTLLGLHGMERIRVEEFHGTVHEDMEGRYKVVPTFHTSYLQRGAHNLIGTVSFDLQVALEVARGVWQHEPIERIIDPPVDWLEAAVVQLESAIGQDPDSVAIASDIETPDKAGGKPENELTPDDDSYTITRYNFAWHPDQGITIPNHPHYHALIRRILQARARHYWWNGYGYDWDRIRVAMPGALDPLLQLDLMIAAHVLQSDVPLGLGFWAPFYSRFGAWKYRSGTDPEDYACIDGPQTLRCGYGIVGDLIQQGQWRAFQEDCHELYHGALKPAQDIGILIDRPALQTFHEDLAAKQLEKLEAMQAHVPLELRPLTNETGTEPDPAVLHPMARTHTIRGELKKDQPDPIKAQLYARALRVERNVSRLIQVCLTCGATEIAKTHRCKDDRGKIDKTKQPAVVPQEQLVVRWFWQEPFNPDSSQQMLAYIKLAGHKPGKNKKTREDSADRETLIRLAKSTKDPFYQVNLDYRAVKKIDSTYALPTMRRVDRELAEGREGRLHPIPTFRPSTMRLSYVSPNITNVVVDKDSTKKNLAGGFRRCVVAAPGCRLLEVDYSGIEAIETGWFSRDPAYIRLAKLGVHAYLASHLLGRPADLRWSDADLLAYFSELKKAHFLIYDQAKRCVHGTNYGLTPYGMASTFPDLYQDEKIAHRVQQIYFEICPTLPTWHGALRQRAYDAGYLGGPGEVLSSVDNACYKRGWAGASPWAHPFQYKHWFWSVLAYKPINESQRLRRMKAKKPSVEINGRWFAIDLGEDSKRVIAFYPQSTARGVLTRPMRNLFTRPDHPSYIGDQYYGRTPFRAPIHDSLLLEVPDRAWDTVCEKVFREMRRPIAEQPLPAAWGMGSHLTVGIEAKAGGNWLDVEKITVPGMGELGLTEETYFGTEEDDEEDASELRVVA